MRYDIMHYRQIDIIRQAEKMYTQKYGIIPFDLSHWNAGEEYKSKLIQVLELPNLKDYSDYKYSYSFSKKIKQSILSKHNNVKGNCVLFSSATTAISTVCAALKAKGINRVCVINPSYFSIFENLTLMDFDVKQINFIYDGIYHIPFEQLKDDFELIWLTQPVFSTGNYLENKELQKLFSKNCYIVCDASMCQIENVIGLNRNYNNVILIFSPQKVISLNGIKFCYIICNDCLAKDLEDWGDVVSGSLPFSSVIAVQHFLSENYSSCVNIHKEFVRNSHNIIDNIIARSNGKIMKCGLSIDSTYESLTIPKVSFNKHITLDFMYNFILSTNASITPGCVNGFDAQNGFCFRINHTLDNDKKATALNRIISYIGHLQSQ